MHRNINYIYIYIYIAIYNLLTNNIKLLSCSCYQGSFFIMVICVPCCRFIKIIYRSVDITHEGMKCWPSNSRSDMYTHCLTCNSDNLLDSLQIRNITMLSCTGKIALTIVRSYVVDDGRTIVYEYTDPCV